MSLIADIAQVFGGSTEQNSGDASVAWLASLQPASFRGVPFGVLTSECRFGRRVSVHEYPYRDTPWVEDIGRSARRISLVGFLITDSAIYGGGDVLAQRERMIAACEEAGSGTLVHPTLGKLTVNLSENGFAVTERIDSGRYFEISFSFIEAGQRVFPSIIASTGDAVSSAADAVDAAASIDFSSRAAPALKNGAVVGAQAINAAATWARSAQNLANDATNLYHLVGTLKGTYGRYFGGRNKGGLSSVTSAVTGTASTLNSLIAQGAIARNAVTNASSLLITAAGNL